MGHRLLAGAAGALLGLSAGLAWAQTAPPPAAAPPLAIPNPRYTTLVLEMEVNRPAKAVWDRIGRYCDIGEWLEVPCALTSGVDGEVGAVRYLNVGGGIVEMLVGKTDLSHTYTQPVRVGVPYNVYHGTIEAKPVTATTSKLVYTFFYDTSMLADDAARIAEIGRRRERFTRAMMKMKSLVENDTPRPPAAAR